VKRIHVSAAFFLSIEFQQTGYLVERMYKAAYGDIVDPSTNSTNLLVPVIRRSEFVADAPLIGAGVVVNQGDWQTTLDNGAARRASVLRRVAEHPEFDRRERNRAYVLMQYFGYLRRNPDDAPEAGLNYAGWNFWLLKLNAFNGDAVAAEMVKAFLSSDEYRKRFAQ
jgi:hypothetical protein